MLIEKNTWWDSSFTRFTWTPRVRLVDKLEGGMKVVKKINENNSNKFVKMKKKKLKNNFKKKRFLKKVDFWKSIPKLASRSVLHTKICVPSVWLFGILFYIFILVFCGRCIRLKAMWNRRFWVNNATVRITSHMADALRGEICSVTLKFSRPGDWSDKWKMWLNNYVIW